jgi:peptidoglycan/LPS O-acetylase OafA/YrhL
VTEGPLGATSTRPEPSSGRPRGEFHIPSLDGLRAFSFLIVFLAHAGLYDTIPGGFGVTVFFFLSGYLITTLLRLEYEASARISFRDFYLRRVLRILPPFYAVLVLAVGLAALGVMPGDLRAPPVIAILAHVTNYWTILKGSLGMPAGTGVYWSLAVEEHFYLLFPLLFVFLQRTLPDRRRGQAAILLGICAAVLLWRLALVLALNATTNRTYLASDTRIDSILFGCALAVGANPMLDRPRLSDRVWRTALLPLGVAALLFSFVCRAAWFRETVRYSLQGVALVPVFVVAMRQPGWGPCRVLNWKPLRHVGVLSYSLYLVHQVVIEFGDKQLTRVPIIAREAMALVVSLLIAQAINRLIEKPCARLRRRLAHATWLGARPAPGP